ncbi:MAG: trypsin-like peptidase domain-containing protein [Xenococcus sp. (in: cyanobacteria)]
MKHYISNFGLTAILLAGSFCYRINVSSASTDSCPPPKPTGAASTVDECDEIYRIICQPLGRILTGFRARIGSRTGIITALHGVAGCDNLTASNLLESYTNLRIEQVDIARDLAFLGSPSKSIAGTGLRATTSFADPDLRVVGYPQGIHFQISHQLKPHAQPLRFLYQLLPHRARQALERRGSPATDRTVMSLDGSIQRGYSGAPILTREGFVVGIVNGGLKEGAVNIGWAFPYWQIEWDDVRVHSSEIASLAVHSTNELFGVEPETITTLPPLYLADGGDSVGRIYKYENGELSEFYVRPRGGLSHIALSPDETIYFSDANDKNLYRLQNGREVLVYTHITYLRDIAFDSLGRLYFSESSGAGGDGVIYRLEDEDRAIPYYRVRLSEVDGFWAGYFTFDNDGVLWLSTGNAVPAALYKVEEFQPKRVFSSGDSITGISFTTSGDLLYADWRQKVYRLEMPGFVASKAVFSGLIQWMSDAVPIPSSPTIRDSSVTTTPSTETITLLPDTRDMGKIGGGGVSGSLNRGSNQTFSPPSFGDRGYGNEHRGFISFSLDSLAQDVNILSAKLFTVQGGQAGDLNQSYFQNVLIEEINIGNALDQQDFESPGILLAEIELSELTQKPLDVTNAVKRAQSRGKEYVTFRFRFSVGNDNDNEIDSWALSYSRGQTRLELEISP